MNVIEYIDFDPSKVTEQYKKVRAMIERDDFRSADVKKLTQGGAHARFFRAKLDYTNRLLFSVVHYRGQSFALMLEVIHNHAYEKSRFLQGASIVDDSKIPDATLEDTVRDALPIRYLHPKGHHFHWLDKPISFDDRQETIFRMQAPLIIVGSAGSGKTALTLEKMKQTQGDVLYVTHSAYLAQSARNLYYADGFEQPNQNADFLSYREFIETIRVPNGREANFRDFSGWFARHRQAHGTFEAHQIFEEIRGVITADAGDTGVLTRADYMALGVRQSIFAESERDAVYDIYEKYVKWLQEAHFYDLNLIAHDYLKHADLRYDFVVIDEVQDLTNIELSLVLRTLKKPGNFLLCGDANQIVHPNFFSWSKIKSLFWRDPGLAERQTLSILSANFRNGKEATRVANTLLKIKHARFGSIDRESNFLVEAVADDAGLVELLADKDSVKRELNLKTRHSTQFAVLVMRDEHKAEAKASFDTPLVFSVHEAKGLEYENIVLFNFISGNRAAYKEICEGVQPQDLATSELEYRRAKDKSDKSLEIYKFYVNALYVALTRAIKNLYLIEADQNHPLLNLLDVKAGHGSAAVVQQKSSLEDWQMEARKLELQGKQEQADEIRRKILQFKPVPWPVMDEKLFRETMEKGLAPGSVSNKAKQSLLEYAAYITEPALVRRLLDLRFEPARHFEANSRALVVKFFNAYSNNSRNLKEVLRQVDQYGVDYRLPTNHTPLMAAVLTGNIPLIEALLERGANLGCTDHLGRNALHFALLLAFSESGYADNSFPEIYQLVAPASIDVMANQRLIRLDKHISEYFLFQSCFAIFKTNLQIASHSKYVPDGFTTEEISNVFGKLPASVLRPERARREYISGVLARNEIDRDYPYNRFLFRRFSRGHYFFNPELKVRTGENQWQGIYQALNLELIRETAVPEFKQNLDKVLYGVAAAFPVPK